jgi:hypothetical protein
VVGHPVGADHVAAEEEREDQRPLVAEGVEQGAGVLGVAGDRLGHADLHHEQGHGDREHGVGEVDDPSEVVVATTLIAGRRHRRLLGASVTAPPIIASWPRPGWDARFAGLVGVCLGSPA